MENPDILYQPGAQGGSTLTTQMKPMGMGGPTGPTHFDTSWLQQLAERRAMQEERDRNEARNRMRKEDELRRQMRQKQLDDENRQRQMDAQDKQSARMRQEKQDALDSEEIWVDRFTGQPSHPWQDRAMNTGRRYVPKKGEITTGKSATGFAAESWIPALPTGISGGG